MPAGPDCPIKSCAPTGAAEPPFADTTLAAVHGLLAACAGANPSRALVVLEACDCAGDKGDGYRDGYII